MRSSVFLLFVLSSVACVSTELETPANHPANPQTPSPGYAAEPSVLRQNFDPFAHYEPAPPTTAEGSSSVDSDGAHAGHGAHEHHAPNDGGKVQVADGGEPAIADAGSQTKPKRAQVYTCPMHPEIIRSGPGRCPKCGMMLSPKKGPK